MKILFLTNNEITLPLVHWLEESGHEVALFSERINTDYLGRITPDLVISYSYKFIIGKACIDFMNGRIVNLHISYLPYNRGTYPNIWSFIDDTPKGITIHFIDPMLDKGRIIARKRLDISEDETLRSSYGILHNEIQLLFKSIFPKIDEWENISFIPNEKGSYHSLKDYKTVESMISSWDMKMYDLVKLHKNAAEIAAGGAISPKTIFDSYRLYFTEIGYNNTDNIVKWRSDSDNIKYFRNTNPLTKEAHLKWLEKYKASNTRFDFIINLKENDRQIGTVTVSDINYKEKHCEISYAIFEKDEQGKGYAKEAVGALLYYLESEYSMNKFIAEIHEDNIASVNLITSFSFEKSKFNKYYFDCRGERP
jgi:methionyl-tRNA formyltransferase